MKTTKKLLACLLVMTFLVPVFPMGMQADAATAVTGEGYVSPTTVSTTIKERQNKVLSIMEEMMTIKWRPDQEYSYVYQNDNTTGTLYPSGLSDKQSYAEQGTNPYEGILYTNGGASLFTWKKYLSAQPDANGVYTFTPPTENINWDNFIGNDCADAVYWAWATVSNTISFSSSSYMTPTYGVIPIGSYATSKVVNEKTVYEYKLADTVTRTTGSNSYLIAENDKTTTYSSDPNSDHYLKVFSKNLNTKKICAGTGIATMYKAYSKLQPGDGIVRFNEAGEGHAMIVVSVSYKAPGWFQNGHGGIWSGSTVTCIDQVSSNVKTHTINFYNLFNNGNIPVTCAELHDQAIAPGVEKLTDSVNSNVLTGAVLTSGTIEANYRFSSVDMTITDQSGNVIQTATRHPGSKATAQDEKKYYRYDLSEFGEYDTIIGEGMGKIDFSALPVGNYHCTATAELATGAVLTFRDFDFSKSAEVSVFANTLLLDETIGMRYLFEKEYLKTADGTPITASYSYNGVDYTETEFIDYTVYGRTFSSIIVPPMSAKELGDTIYVKLSCNETPDEYSIKQACFAVIDSANQSQAFKNLAKAILNYGAAAQTYFDYKKDDLVVNPYFTDLVSPEFVDQRSHGEPNGTINILATSLVLRDQIHIKFWFTSDGEIPNDAKVYINGVKTDYEIIPNGDYYTVAIPVAARNMNRLIAVTIRDAAGNAISNTYTDSISSYCYAIKQNNTDPALVDLCEKIATYVHYANIYVQEIYPPYEPGTDETIPNFYF